MAMLTVLALLPMAAANAQTASTPPAPAVKSHALAKIGLALVNPSTWAHAAQVVVFAAEAGTDSVHVVTAAAEKGVAFLDTSLEKIQAKLGGASN